MPGDLVASYLRALTKRLRLGDGSKNEIAKELATHLSESVQCHQIRGLTEEEAERKSIEDLGEPGKLARRLNWVHGFGRYSHRPIWDAVLGGLLPFGLPVLLEEVPGLEQIPTILMVGIAALGISIYALRNFVPAWTVTWLGLVHVVILFVLFNGVYGGLRSGLDLGWAVSYGSAMVATSGVLFLSTFVMARKHVELTMLFLLPLVVLYVGAGYEDVDPAHTARVVPFIMVFATAFAFTYLLTRNRCPRLFAALGFLFYSALYTDIAIHNPAPLNAEGTKLMVIQVLIYIVPLLFVSWPAYFYLKGRRAALP